MAHGLMTISWVDGALEDMAAARKERARQEHEEREARLAPLRAKRRAAEAGKQTRENAAVEPW